MVHAVRQAENPCLFIITEVSSCLTGARDSISGTIILINLYKLFLKNKDYLTQVFHKWNFLNSNMKIDLPSFGEVFNFVQMPCTSP